MIARSKIGQSQALQAAVSDAVATAYGNATDPSLAGGLALRGALRSGAGAPANAEEGVLTVDASGARNGGQARPLNSRLPSDSHAGTATAKQIEANRVNAQKSTGPRTDAGKAKSSRNALRHGLFSKVPILPGESAAEFANLTLELFATFQPRADEEFLVHLLVHKEWMLKRVRAAEAEMGNILVEQGKTAARALAEDYMGIGSGGMLRLMNHELRIGSSIQSLRNKLAKLQKDRPLAYCGDGIRELTDYSEESLRELLGGSDEPLDGTDPIGDGENVARGNEADSGAEESAAMQNEPESPGSAPPEARVA